jgi:hypothetical protein
MARRPHQGPSQEDKLEALHAQLVEAVAELATSEGWARMLAAAARFNDYSGGGVGVFELRECRVPPCAVSSRVNLSTADRLPTPSGWPCDSQCVNRSRGRPMVRPPWVRPTITVSVAWVEVPTGTAPTDVTRRVADGLRELLTDRCRASRHTAAIPSVRGRARLGVLADVLGLRTAPAGRSGTAAGWS